MNPEDDLPDELTHEYRRASAEQAGRPDASTRAAILAEARAHARRRLPAANNNRVWWRAAASVAVVGVGVLLWRQVDREVAPLATAPTVVQVESMAADTAAAPDIAPDGVVAADRSVVANSAQRAESEAAAKSFDTQEAARPVAPPPPPAPVERAAPQLQMPDSVASTAITSATRSLRLQASGAANAAEILKVQFPAENASSTPPRALWVLQDTAGGVLRRGVLAGNEGFDVATQNLELEFPGRRIGPWAVTPVTNDRGIAMQLGVASLQ